MRKEYIKPTALVTSVDKTLLEGRSWTQISDEELLNIRR